MIHCHPNQGLTRLRLLLVVFAEATIASRPTEGPLDHPTLGQSLEPLSLVTPLDDLQIPTTFGLRPFDQPLLLIDPVRPDDLQARAATLDFLEHRFRPVIVLHTGRGPPPRDQQPRRVPQEMALPPLDRLPRIETLDPADLGRLDRLAVRARFRGFRVALGRLWHHPPQRTMDPVDRPAPSPPAEGAVDRPRRREVMGQQVPGTAGAKVGEDRVADLAHRGLARPSSPGGRGQQRVEDL